MNEFSQTATPTERGFTAETAEQIFLEDDVMGEVARSQTRSNKVNVRFFMAQVMVNNAKPISITAAGDQHVVKNGPEMRLHIEIAPVSDPLISTARPALERDKRMYPIAYKAYTETGSEGYSLNGMTDLADLPGITRMECDQFRLAKIYSIEQAADLNEHARAAIGMAARRIENLAKAWVERRDSSDIESTANRITEMEERFNQLMAQNDHLKSELGAKTTALSVLQQTVNGSRHAASGINHGDGASQGRAFGAMLEGDMIRRPEPGMLIMDDEVGGSEIFGAVDSGPEAEDGDESVPLPSEGGGSATQQVV